MSAEHSKILLGAGISPWKRKRRQKARGGLGGPGGRRHAPAFHSRLPDSIEFYPEVDTRLASVDRAVGHAARPGKLYSSLP
eukprot:1646066-Pyramimonas_sp.AAC.1